MTRSILPAAALVAGLLALPLAAFAQAAAPAEAGVAGAFIAAAKAQDRKAALSLMDEQVSIRFPSRAAETHQGRAEGQPFVIGYLDGLFGGEHDLSVEGPAPRGGAVRFLARDRRSNERYAIDLEVRNDRVVSVIVEKEPGLGGGQSVAALDPS